MQLRPQHNQHSRINSPRWNVAFEVFSSPEVATHLRPLLWR